MDVPCPGVPVKTQEMSRGGAYTLAVWGPGGARCLLINATHCMCHWFEHVQGLSQTRRSNTALCTVLLCHHHHAGGPELRPCAVATEHEADL